MTEKHSRRTHRLPDFDYAQPGAYFVTIVTFERNCLFGEIKDGEMICNAFGDIASWEWECLPKRFSYVQIDEFIVMPNHTHAIIIINDSLLRIGPEETTRIENILPVGAR